MISPANSSCGIDVNEICNAGAGGSTSSSNFLSNCTGLSTFTGPSGLIITVSKFNFPQRLDGSFVAYSQRLEKMNYFETITSSFQRYCTDRNLPDHPFDDQLSSVTRRQFDDNHFLLMLVQLNGFDECRSNDVVDRVSVIIAHIRFEQVRVREYFTIFVGESPQ